MAQGGGERWEEVLALVPGEHVHMDELVENPPPPGSRDWVPMIEDVIRFLTASGDHWMVSINLGECDELPTGDVTTRYARRIVTRANVITPPAIFRWRDASTPDTWQGEKRSWKRRTSDQVVEIITVSRSAIEAAAGEGFTVWLGYEVGSPQ